MTNKRYLTGIDWLIHAFDHMNQKKIGKGNVFHIVFEVNGLVNVDLFEQELNQFISSHFIFKGRAARAFNLAPYWKIDKDKEVSPVSISSRRVQEASKFIPFCIEISQKYDQSSEGYLYCDVIFHDEKSYVFFTFSHKLFDGLGAELFVDAFERYREGKQSYVFPDRRCQPSHLNRWGEKFKAGRHVNRKLLWLSPGRKVRALPIKKGKQEYQYKVIQFNENQTKKIIERADKEAGYLLIMPFLLSQAIYAFNQLFNRKGIRNDNMVVPVTVNARKKGEEREMFFNHLSFMFFKFTDKEAENPMESIKNQLYEQTKSRFSEKFSSNAMLMRIAPIPILSNLLGIYSRGKMASFSFSYLGETVFSGRKLLGKETANLFHLPVPSVPPGLGVFVNNYNGKFNLTISYLNTLLNDEDIEFLVNALREMPNG
ncbi:MAG: hypothetical protein P9M07_05750 [Candidatus Aceula meridiana]|nr:hypothetical protein [Candidatus Aceula meridiana]